MLSRFTLLFTVAAVFATAFASPLVARDGCKPNFEGRPQTIYRSPGSSQVNQWTPQIRNGGHVTITGGYFEPAWATGEWLVPFTGQYSGSYQFKAAADSARQYALEGSANGNLVFKPIKYSFPNNQEFSISCNYCWDLGPSWSRIFQYDCEIKHVASGKCVDGWTNGATLSLKTCTGSWEQLFNFVNGTAA